MEHSDSWKEIKGTVVKVRNFSIFHPRDVELQNTRIDGAHNAPIAITVETLDGKVITSYSPLVLKEKNGQTFKFYKDYNVGEMFP